MNGTFIARQRENAFRCYNTTKDALSATSSSSTAPSVSLFEAAPPSYGKLNVKPSERAAYFHANVGRMLKSMHAAENMQKPLQTFTPDKLKLYREGWNEADKIQFFLQLKDFPGAQRGREGEKA